MTYGRKVVDRTMAQTSSLLRMLVTQMLPQVGLFSQGNVLAFQ